MGTICYKEEEKKQREANVREFGREVRNFYNGKSCKIPNSIVLYSNRYGVNPYYVARGMVSGEDDAAEYSVPGFFWSEGFEKNLGKQAFHESLAADYIKGLPEIGGEHFTRLPNTGHGAVYVNPDGEIVPAGNKSPDNKSKSVDFMWEYEFNGEKLRFYCTHKYTNEDGGAQKNQNTDVKVFLDNAVKNLNPDVRFVSITEGEYYHKGEHTKIDELKELYDCENIIISDIDNVFSDCMKEIIRWLGGNEKFTESEKEAEISRIRQYMS